MNGWDLWHCMDSNGHKHSHVVPVDDLREHELEVTCWCHPVEDHEAPNLYGHNALDKREEYEQGRKIS